MAKAKEVKVKEVKTKDLLRFLFLNKESISGIRLRDGSIFVGRIRDILSSPNDEIWIDFDGASPAPVADQSMSGLLTAGLEAEETLFMRQILPLDDINYFILSMTTRKMLQDRIDKERAKAQQGVNFKEKEGVTTDMSQEPIAEEVPPKQKIKVKPTKLN